MSLNILATYVRKIVPKNFQKSSNLVTLSLTQSGNFVTEFCLRGLEGRPFEKNLFSLEEIKYYFPICFVV